MKASCDTHIARLRKEYGMEFRAIVAHYAGLRISRRATAEALGISYAHFRRYLHRFNLNALFVPREQMTPDCRGGWHHREKTSTTWSNT